MSKMANDPTCPFDVEDVYSDAVLHEEVGTNLKCPRCGNETMSERYRVINGGPSSDISHWQQWCACGHVHESSGLNTSDYCY